MRFLPVLLIVALASTALFRTRGASSDRRIITRQAPQATQSPTNVALDLIRRQQYNDAITRLELVLETNPQNAEALTYLATAHLYHDLDFSKAKREFEEALKAGGGATFFVTHSHEKISTDDIVDYCRGWLHLRRDSVEFLPTEGAH